MSDIKVRVGQQNSVKVISSISGGSNFAFNAINAENVIGGIASVTQLNVSGISTFVGVSTFNSNVYIDGEVLSNSLLTRDAYVTGILTVSSGLNYGPSYSGGIAYFDNTALMVSTGGTEFFSIDYTNYILTTDNSGVPTWSSAIDGGSY